MKRNFALGAVLWVLPILASVGYAQTSKNAAVTMKIPFEFVAGNRTFPAGVYKFRSLLNSVPGQASIDVLEIRGTVAGYYAAIVTDVVPAPESDVQVVFIRRDGRVLLSEVWQPGKPGRCRLRHHDGGMQVAAYDGDRVAVAASAAEP